MRQLRPGQRRVMDALEADLTSWAEANVIGRRVDEAEEAVADHARALALRLYPGAFVHVTTSQPYRCPVERCPHREPEYATCPIHLRDLRDDEIVAEMAIRPRIQIQRIQQTIKIGA